MSGHDDLAAATDPVLEPEEQSRMSRRSVLRTAAGAGIAATALATTGAPALAAARPAAAPRPGHESAGHETGSTGHETGSAGHETAGEPIVAHLRDARTGEIDVFRGMSQVRLRDPALAALLIRASR